MESLNPDYDDIRAYFELQSRAVQTHSRIVDPDLVGQDFMLHIDKNTPEVFWPMMPRSADPREDNTTPRITVAPTLLGCYIGYNRAHDDFAGGSEQNTEEEDRYRGGYIICELPFKHCLLVDDHLVPDASRSQEHWLVPYSKDTLEYKPTIIGKVFVSTVAQKAASGTTPSTFITMYVEVTRKGGIRFSPNTRLQEGWHKAEVMWNKGVLHDCRAEDHIKLSSITQEEFDAAKRLSAALLERLEARVMQKAPAFTNW